ncbi:MAG: DUF4432 family protein [Anaerolineae bacterium]|nr:DUF4432 family protein [Anaerolineae bacterium]
MPRTSLHTYGCRISDEWRLRGMRAAVLENDLLRVTVLLDRGAEIVEFCYKPLDCDPLLRIPIELRNPSEGAASIHGGGGTFLDYYAGGWQEIVPNGGPPVTYKGADYGQHGEVCLLPWDSEVIEDSPARVALHCSVRALRTPLYLERTMTLERGRAVLILDERLTNEAGEPLDVMWGHHVAFGLPFLQEGATIATSAQTLIAHEELPGFEPRRLQLGQQSIWPQGQSSTGSSVDMSIVPPRSEASGREMAYLTDFNGAAWYAITNRDQRAGFAMRWDGDLFRYLWLWQEFAHATGYPWWGRVYTMALEPWTSYPTLGLPEAIRRGTQLTLQAGQTVTTRLTATAYAGVAQVSGVHEDGAVF